MVDLEPAELGGKAPPIQRYRIWPLLSHNPWSRPDRGARHATPRFHNFTRRRNWWRAIRRACAAEGDAGDRDPRPRRRSHRVIERRKLMVIEQMTADARKEIAQRPQMPARQSVRRPTVLARSDGEVAGPSLPFKHVSARR